MKRLLVKTVSVWLAAWACLLIAPAGAAPVSYQMVPVGNAGNAGATGDFIGFGAVGQAFQRLLARALVVQPKALAGACARRRVCGRAA